MSRIIRTVNIVPIKSRIIIPKITPTLVQSLSDLLSDFDLNEMIQSLVPLPKTKF